MIAIKEPNGSQSADLIIAALPRARLLFLLRDGRDVVDSELAGSLDDGWVTKEFPGARVVSSRDRLSFATNSAYKWLWRTEVVQRVFAEHPGPKHFLRYEDLLRDPHGELRSLFSRLELDVDDQQLADWIHRHSFDALPSTGRGPREFFRAAQPGLWRESLTSEEQTAIAEIHGPKLRELGYES